LKSSPSIFSGKKVLITGHTGFKGAWLAEWLLLLKAKVTGLALPSSTTPSLFEQLNLAQRLDHRLGDIRDPELVKNLVQEIQPDFVFHLAAQPLVRLSYAKPVETYSTNVLGTIHVLEALRTLEKPCTAILITTDKCYENREWLHAYREEDSLGGYDPYSSSKAAAEIAIASWRRSFFAQSPVRLASARAGNVIGGGDWALDRIVPDAMRSLAKNEEIPVRNPHATRPWQHVLEPLGGYLLLATRLANDEKMAGPYNFGPQLESNRPVQTLVEEILKHWRGAWTDQSNPGAVHEASLLNLATDKAFHLLQWQPRWTFAEAIAQTVQWYRQAEEWQHEKDFSTKIQNLTQGQIEAYQSIGV
jgi:CDP-glucose 4,6-dehydratase